MLEEINNQRLAVIVNSILETDKKLLNDYNKISDIFDFKYHYRLSNSFIKKFIKQLNIK